MLVMGTKSEYNEDYIMRASYDSLMIDIDNTLEYFSVFSESDYVFEIEKGTGQRSEFIDTLIEYFQNLEEYEKCGELLQLKNKIIEYGN